MIKMGSGGVTLGGAVDLDSRDLRFESYRSLH